MTVAIRRIGLQRLTESASGHRPLEKREQNATRPPEQVSDKAKYTGQSFCLGGVHRALVAKQLVLFLFDTYLLGG